MEIARLDNETLVIRDIEAFAAGLLRQIPLEIDPGDSKAAEERLFSRPMENPRDSLNEEWKEYVEPELRHLFDSAAETVSGDLKMMRVADASLSGVEAIHSLEIPVGHLDQWLNVLNQARLVLAAKNEFTEQELSNGHPHVINSQREMNLFQVNFYGMLQEVFLHVVRHGSVSGDEP